MFTTAEIGISEQGQPIIYIPEDLPVGKILQVQCDEDEIKFFIDDELVGHMRGTDAQYIMLLELQKDKDIGVVACPDPNNVPKTFTHVARLKQPPVKPARRPKHGGSRFGR